MTLRVEMDLEAPDAIELTPFDTMLLTKEG